MSSDRLIFQPLLLVAQPHCGVRCPRWDEARRRESSPIFQRLRVGHYCFRPFIPLNSKWSSAQLVQNVPSRQSNKSFLPGAAHISLAGIRHEYSDIRQVCTLGIVKCFKSILLNPIHTVPVALLSYGRPVLGCPPPLSASSVYDSFRRLHFAAVSDFTPAAPAAVAVAPLSDQSKHSLTSPSLKQWSSDFLVEYESLLWPT